MVTLRRNLKYAPVAMMGLLVVAWGISIYREFGCDISVPPSGRYNSGFENGAFYFGFNSIGFSRFYWLSGEEQANTSMGLGRFAAARAFHPDGNVQRWWFDCPVACILTAMAPLVMGAFTSFRFRLWHYLAYTALVAIELAYYLRWQL